MRRSNPEVKKLQSLKNYECELRRQGFHLIAGVDEAGRGPLAGPVVAAAVVFPEEAWIPGVDDSKRLSPERREFLFAQIKESALDVAVGEASVHEIDESNILQATFLAMRRALAGLKMNPDLVLIDGNRGLPGCPMPQLTLVRGDSCCFSIAAASIIAKVHRDRMMQRYHELFPQYRFDRNKGYGTREHLHAILKYGYCELHRRTFNIRETLDGIEKRIGR